MNARPANFADVLSRVPGARQSGDTWVAPCPAPGHRTPAGHLSLKDALDKVLISCQGGRHSYEDLCAALGFDSLTYPHNGKEREIVATYDYTDANGKLLYQVVRLSPKAFKQRRPDGAGGWIWDLKGVERVLYRLPEVLEAVREGRTVAVVEGEKDADALREKGLTATTNSGGAEKWRPEYAEALKGASVVVLPDRDGPGRRHAAMVGDSLHGKARSLKVIELPDRDGHQVKDASDWLAAGGTVPELEWLAAEAPEYRPSPGVGTPGFVLTPLGDLLAEPEEVTPWLWDSTLPVGGLSLLASKPKIGKSTLARNLALAVARGEAFLGRATTQGPVVYLALEEKRQEVAAHFTRMGATDEPILVHFGQAPEKALKELGQAIGEEGAALAIVDPILRLIRLKDGNDYAEVTRAFEPLLMLARNTGCHILTVHHLGKREGEGGDGILGSTALFGAVDTALILRRREDARTLESLQRYGEDFPRTVLAFDREAGTLEAAGTVEALELLKVGKAVLEALGEGELTEAELRKELGGNTGLVGKTLRHLVAEGQVARTGEGRRGDPFRYKRILVSRFPYMDKLDKQDKQETEPPLTDGETPPPTLSEPARSGAWEEEL